MAVDFVNEKYKNIGAFTKEHLLDVIFTLKGESSVLNLKGNIPFTNESNVFDGDTTEYSFFQANLSTSLIHGEMMGRLRILGNCTFSNIWLIDRLNAFSISETSSNTDYGLILRV